MKDDTWIINSTLNAATDFYSCHSERTGQDGEQIRKNQTGPKYKWPPLGKRKKEKRMAPSAFKFQTLRVMVGRSSSDFARLYSGPALRFWRLKASSKNGALNKCII